MYYEKDRFFSTGRFDGRNIAVRVRKKSIRKPLTFRRNMGLRL